MTYFDYTAVLWDIDGTLANSEPVHERSFDDACRTLGLKLPSDFHEKTLGLSEERVHAWMQDRCGLTLDLADWAALRQKAYLARITEVTWMPEAQPVWTMLAQRGIVQATVSNSDRILVDANLDRLGLLGAHESVSRCDVAQGKPAPDPYLLAAQRLGVDPARIAVIEDSATGMAAGQAAGMSVFMMAHYVDAGRDGWQPLRALAEHMMQGS